jgi:hypothetical protein
MELFLNLCEKKEITEILSHGSLCPSPHRNSALLKGKSRGIRSVIHMKEYIQPNLQSMLILATQETITFTIHEIPHVLVSNDTFA